MGSAEAEDLTATSTDAGRKELRFVLADQDELAELFCLACALVSSFGDDFVPLLQLTRVPTTNAAATAFTSRDFIQIRQGGLISKKTKLQLGGSF